MPPCGIPFNENSVPPWTRGDFRGVLNGEPTHPGVVRHPPDGGDFQASLQLMLVLNCCDVAALAESKD